MKKRLIVCAILIVSLFALSTVGAFASSNEALKVSYLAKQNTGVQPNGIAVSVAVFVAGVLVGYAASAVAVAAPGTLNMKSKAV